MKKQIGKFTAFRYELVHGEDADFIAYQRNTGHGRWRTIASWIIPQTPWR